MMVLIDLALITSFDLWATNTVTTLRTTLTRLPRSCWSSTSGYTQDTGPARGHRRKPHDNDTMSAIIKVSITNKTGRSSVIVKW